MDMTTYTTIFHVEKRIYAIYDMELWAPVALRQALAFVGALLLEILLFAKILGILPLTFSTAWIYVVSAVAVAWWIDQPGKEHRRPLEVVWDHICYYTEPKELHGLQVMPQAEECLLSITVPVIPEAG